MFLSYSLPCTESRGIQMLSSHSLSLTVVRTLLLAPLFLASPLVAQEEQTLPTLRVDRIPSSPAFSGQTRAASADSTPYEVESIASGLSAPWALAFLPDGEILIEYVGTMRIMDAEGQLSEPLGGLPEMSNGHDSRSIFRPSRMSSCAFSSAGYSSRRPSLRYSL